MYILPFNHETFPTYTKCYNRHLFARRQDFTGVNILAAQISLLRKEANVTLAETSPPHPFPPLLSAPAPPQLLSYTGVGVYLILFSPVCINK